MRSLAAFALVVLLAAPGCRSVYYDLNESLLGRHKRDILVSRVERGREEQQRAQEQFVTTFERFQEVTGYEGGDLEKLYRSLEREYERSADRAEQVRERVDAIEEVAEDLFREWEREIGEISDAGLRRQSTRSLRETRSRYAGLIGAMGRAEARMEPVLVAFRDQVLFLKHNLNARAISSLETNLLEIENDVAGLIREMQAAIREADAFLAELEG